MERFFIVTEESNLYNDYFNYEKNNKEVIEHYKTFKKVFEIESGEFIPLENGLYITPTRQDADKFDKLFTKGGNGGLRKFKKNSLVSKYWVTSLKDKKLKILSKPMIVMYFETYGNSRSRLFNVDKTVYCSIEFNYDFTEVPRGFKEIKASEFFKVIEGLDKQ